MLFPGRSESSAETGVSVQHSRRTSTLRMGIHAALVHIIAAGGMYVGLESTESQNTQGNRIPVSSKPVESLPIPFDALPDGNILNQKFIFRNIRKNETTTVRFFER